ncbi:LexA family transcriptional regulator [uncultured Bacteroides sp.]|uniref:LexA family transcriptional regulator n=1 Tax=uncultured Bacteroides sp. TaxID=162156 RepID=UPI00204CE344|nr:LexA family transcriptional regulator [uncultured Bacteroides sp.]DAQ05120.1 MAG TPA: hypothetical protein [Bacteriophage sp.]
MDKKQMLEAILGYYTNGNKAKFASILGVSPQTISAWVARNTFDSELIYTKCSDISADWLLTGKGEMLKNSDNNSLSSPTPSKIDSINDHEAIPFAEAARNGLSPIPLVTQTAAAGFGNANFSIEERDVKEYYVIPKFKYCKVDFMIEVSGLSMYPYFNSGDVIACSILRNTQFIQWNKCHVIATREQGILVKRLMPGDDMQHLRAISDNKEYPPFDIPVDEITGIALVVGSVSLE